MPGTFVNMHVIYLRCDIILIFYEIQQYAEVWSFFIQGDS
jgi:hypothetical protein